MKNIFCLALALACSAAGPVYAETVIVALGDSTTAGTPGFESPREAPPNGTGEPKSQYAYWAMKKLPGRRIVNMGVRGQRTEQILARFDQDVLSFHPKAVVVLAGVNDIYQGYPSETIKQNLRAIYDKASEHGIKVLACTILPYNSATAQELARIHELNEWIAGASISSGLGYCDTYRAVEHPRRPGYLAGTPDGMHPDVKGYRRIGEAIAAALEKMGV